MLFQMLMLNNNVHEVYMRTNCIRKDMLPCQAPKCSSSSSIPNATFPFSSHMNNNYY